MIRDPTASFERLGAPRAGVGAPSSSRSGAAVKLATEISRALMRGLVRAGVHSLALRAGALLGSMACAPYAEQAKESDEAPGSETGAATEAGKAPSPRVTDTSGSTGTGPEGSGPLSGDHADVSCADIVDAPEPEEHIVFRFYNASGHDVWLESLSCLYTFEVDDPRGASIAQSMAGACTLCADLLEGRCETWCEETCDGYFVRVQPGGVYEETWSGMLRDTVTLACEGCEGACDMRSLAPPGDHIARVTLYETCDGLADACTCQASASGSCEVWGATSTSRAIQVEAAFSVPETTLVQLSLP
jgi:hypothetical protein